MTQLKDTLMERYVLSKDEVFDLLEQMSRVAGNETKQPGVPTMA
jgi:hypothetical protein